MADFPLMKKKMDKYEKEKVMCITWDEMEVSESEEDSDDEEASWAHGH